MSSVSVSAAENPYAMTLYVVFEKKDTEGPPWTKITAIIVPATLYKSWFKAGIRAENKEVDNDF